MDSEINFCPECGPNVSIDENGCCFSCGAWTGGEKAIKLYKENERLLVFVRDLFIASDWPDGGDIDGFEFQELAAKHGVLTPETRTEPCQENCWCSEYHGDMSAGVTCYRKAKWLLE